MARYNGKDIIGILLKGRLVKTETKTVSPTREEQVIVPSEGYDALSSVTVQGVTVESTSTPVEISTETEMNAVLTNATGVSIGSVYKYVGPTTETYENGALYIIESAQG